MKTNLPPSSSHEKLKNALTVAAIVLLVALAFFVSSASSASATLLNGYGFFEFTPSGTIIVEKQTVPDGDPTNFDFTGSLNATLSDNQTATRNVVEGQSTVIEVVPFGWSLIDISCDDDDSSGDINTKTATFNVSVDETVKCIFTNTKNPAIYLPLIVNQKSQ